jgi:TRAP-type C4-dicarboxylate transport system permease small subunit
MDLSPVAREERTMEHDISEILLISISLCFIIGGSVFAAMVIGKEYGVLEIPYGPYILLLIAVVIVILAGLIVITGMEKKKET